MTVRLGVELGITEKSVYLEEDEDSDVVVPHVKSLEAGQLVTRESEVRLELCIGPKVLRQREILQLLLTDEGVEGGGGEAEGQRGQHVGDLVIPHVQHVQGRGGEDVRRGDSRNGLLYHNYYESCTLISFKYNK
jgi:hypothetical protein